MHAIPWRREFTDLFSHPAAKIYKYPAMFVAAINWQRGAQILQNVDHAWTDKMPTNKMSTDKMSPDKVSTIRRTECKKVTTLVYCTLLSF